MSEAEIAEMFTNNLISAAETGNDILAESSKLVLYDGGEEIIEPAIYVESKLVTSNSTEYNYYDHYDFYIPILKESKTLFPFLKRKDILRRSPTAAVLKQ